jgi:hypothetical protein
MTKSRLSIPAAQDESAGQIHRRGFAPVDARLVKYARYSRSCYNCDSYCQAPGDQCEVCQDPEVTKYDMVVTETNIFCSRWKPPKRKEPPSVRALFKSQQSGG